MKISFLRENGSTLTELWRCSMIGFMEEKCEFLWVFFRFVNVNL